LEEIMRTHTFAFRVVLIALLLAALACNAVTNALGGNSRVDDAQATADALSTEAAEVFDDLDDIDPVDEATPDVEEPDDESPTEEAEEPETEATEDFSDLFSGDAPEDVPVMEGDLENFYAQADVVTYLTESPYADVLAFYKTEMEANGWTNDPSLSTEFGEIATLSYNKDNRTATVSILTDVTSGKTLVAVNILTN
jgi:hypothetical protein